MTSNQARGLTTLQRAALRLQSEWLKRGWIARLLVPLAMLYGGIWRLRAWGYQAGWRASYRPSVPVIVVGNLIAGGAGKTPTVLAIVQHLRRAGWRPGIVSRGHGGNAQTAVDVEPDTPSALCGDEPLLLRLRSGVPVVVHRKRAEAARVLLASHPAVNILICDDALQHHAIQRDVEVDALRDQLIGALMRRMSEDPARVSESLSLVFVVQSLERVGDHAKNIAEYIMHVVSGVDSRHPVRQPSVGPA